MKNLLAAVFMFCAATAWAQDGGGGGSVSTPTVGGGVGLLVVVQRAPGADAQAQLNMVRGISRTFNIPLRVVGWNQVKTHPLRRGTLYPTTYANTDSLQFAAVIHVGFSRGLYTGGNSLGYFPDSLSFTNANVYATVPQIFLFQQTAATYTDAVYCTTGVASVVTYAAEKDTTYAVYTPGYPRAWKDAAAALAVFNATRPTGTFRVLEGIGASNGLLNRDSIAMVANPDTGVVWENRSGAANAAPAIFVLTGAGGGFSPGAGVTAFMLALARADSVSGGRVFTDKTALPVKMGLHIDDGWKRGTATQSSTGGVSTNDSTAIKGSIDSLATLRVPFVVGVEVDSLSTTPVDKTWWERAAPYVYYTPHMHSGTVNTSMFARASFTHPTDLFGSNTSGRRAAFGDGSFTGADSSMVAIGAGAFNALQSTFGAGRIDHVAMPPFDDWLPQAASFASMGKDSLISALAAAGFVGVRANSSCQACNAYRQGTTAQGIDIEWHQYIVRYGRMAGLQFRVIPTLGYPNWGGYPNLTNTLNNNNCFASRVLGLRIVPPTLLSTQYDFNGGCGICAIHAGDLGSSGLTGNLNRNGWWLFKWNVNRFKAVNALAGRNLMMIDKPENIYR